MGDIKYHVKKEGPEYKVHFHVEKGHYEYTINTLIGECEEKKHPEPATSPANKEPVPKICKLSDAILAAQSVYKDYPRILEAVNNWLKLIGAM